MCSYVGSSCYLLALNIVQRRVWRNVFTEWEGYEVFPTHYILHYNLHFDLKVFQNARGVTYYFFFQVCELQSNRSRHVGWCLHYGSGVVCLVEETFSWTILMSELHLIVHLVDEIALCGTMFAHWMFFLEHFIKTLKDFVRKVQGPKEAYLRVGRYKSLLYIFQNFLAKWIALCRDYGAMNRT